MKISWIQRIFYSVDVFASKIQLTVFSKQQNSSLFSQALTVIVICSTIVILKDDLYNSFTQSTPQVLNTQQNSKVPPIYKLEPHNFTYAFLVADYKFKTVHGLDKYFTFHLNWCHRQRHGQLTPTINCTIIPLEECSLGKHFQTQSQYDYFKFYNFSSVSCISYDWWSKNQLIFLNQLVGGTTQAVDYYYLNLRLSVCRNTTKSQTCSSQEEMNKMLSGILFMSYISTNQVDHSLKGNPYLLSIKSKYTTISQIFSKTQTITFSTHKTFTDVGYVSNKIEEDQAIQITDSQEFSDSITQDQAMINQAIIFDDLEQIALRQYNKLSQIMGQIGGLYSVLYQIVSTIGHHFILAGLKIDLVSWITKKSSKDKNSLQKEPPKSYFKRKYYLIQDIFKILAGFKIENQRNLEIINKHLDITYLIEKILEIDKLKFVLLDQELYNLFNSIPLINIDQKIADHTLKQSLQQSMQTQGKFIFINDGKSSNQTPNEKNDSLFEEMQEGQIQIVSSNASKYGSKGLQGSKQQSQIRTYKNISSLVQEGGFLKSPIQEQIELNK